MKISITIFICLFSFACVFAKSSCAKEGELNSGPITPQYARNCCEGLSGFEIFNDNRYGLGELCFDPSKGIPRCDKIGTKKEGWYYVSEKLIKYDTCSQKFVCGKEGEVTGRKRKDAACCAGLSGYNWQSNFGVISLNPLCYDPKKGIPACKHIGSSNEGWYYPNGKILKQRSCGDNNRLKDSVKNIIRTINTGNIGPVKFQK